MSKTGIFYGSSTGNTESVAKRIAAKLGVASGDIHDIGVAASTGKLRDYDILLLGSSTWGIGDLQDDWEGALNSLPAAVAGKKVALFGCGDSASYPDSFCSAVGKLYAAVKDHATVVGFTDTAGYAFDGSEALVDDRFAGLLIDEDNESNLTEQRIEQWTEQLGKTNS
ncbi:MAG: flavodoxin FldA [Prevotellaceae bacterium]|jgi:flavodoxin I|nr:flavodoxin FldA [Prevotellaceae bacterium]